MTAKARGPHNQWVVRTMSFSPYANLGGNSGVKSTESIRGQLTVKFLDGSQYTYTNKSAGQYSMRRMRQLADRGQGLNRYINLSVKKNYESKSTGAGK